MLSWLLLLYPKSFREEYEREIRTTFRDRWRDGERFSLIASTIADVTTTALHLHWEMLMQDLRYAFRTLRQNPTFTASVIGTLALAIGATTAIFTLFHTSLIQPLPFRDPDRLVRIVDTNQKMNIRFFASSIANVVEWQRRSTSFEALAAFQDYDVNLSDNSNPERVPALTVHGPFWQALGIDVIAGRGFLPEEDQPGKDRVAIISERLWDRRYQRDPNIIGREIRTGTAKRTIVGIAPVNLGFQSVADLIIPLAPNVKFESRGDRRVEVIGRIRPGVTTGEALADLNRVYEELAAESPKDNGGWNVRFLDTKAWIIDANLRTSLNLLIGAVGLLLLIACSNIANLLLARAAARGREVAVRQAMGASRARLVRQLVTESLLLATVGGVLGVGLAAASMRAILAMLPMGLPNSASIEMSRFPLNGTVLAFAFATTVLTGLLFGLAPAMIAARGDIQMVLQAAGRTASAASRMPLRQFLIAAQVALATVLVAGALFLIESFSRRVRADLGFQQDHLLTARFSPDPTRYNDGEKADAYYRAILAEVRTLPGVESAGITSEIPLGPVNTSMRVVQTERAPEIQTAGIQAAWRIITSDYLATLRIPLQKGRFWTANEDYSSMPILISRELEMRLWPNGENPIGRRVRLSNGRDFTVIGVTGDIRQRSAAERQPTPVMYFPPGFTSWFTMNLVVRATGNPVALAGSLREAVRRADPAQPLFDIRTMEEHIARTASAQRLFAFLLGLFAALALLLGAVGVVGVVAYSVARRRPELALRLALGATTANVIRQVTGKEFAVCLAGLIAGLAGAWALRNTISALLFGVEPGNPATYAVSAVVLLAVALVACWLPARRVASIDPATALRSE